MAGIGPFIRTPDRTKVVVASFLSDGTACEINGRPLLPTTQKPKSGPSGIS